VHPAPSIFTFSIILHELHRRHHVALAKKIFGAVRQHNVAPGLVTWNTVLRGYAAAQDAQMAVDTLRDLEAEGHVPDSQTFKAFGKLKEQQTALDLMQDIIERNKKNLGRMQMDA
jgi:pentatricopeptide repeat protein